VVLLPLIVFGLLLMLSILFPPVTLSLQIVAKDLRLSYRGSWR